MTNTENFNNQNIGEEILNAVSHGIAAILSIAGTVYLIICANKYSDMLGIVSSCLYGAALIILFSMSTLYHSMTNRTAKKIFQVFDHCSVFILILGSYIPICLSLLRSSLGWFLLGLNTLFTVLGIVANSISVNRWHKISLVIYLLMGWSIVIAVPSLLSLIPITGWLLLVSGGLCYSVGVLFYRAEKPRYMHFIWHLLVLAGAILHYFFILLYVICRN